MIRRLGLLILRSVAGVAIRRETLELSVCRLFMTRIAIHHRVCANQWKAVLVTLNRLDVGVPALDRVAGLAVRAHLPAMNIRVAIRALAAYICKNRLGVARGASYVGVHPTQRVLRLVVIEFWDRADRFPSCLGMAVLTGNGQRAMRAPRTVVRGAPP